LQWRDKEGTIFTMQAKQQKSTLAYNETIKQDWYAVDADGQILGRLAVKVAMILMGKHKPIYTPNVDTGDFVVITNADKVRVSGKKALAKEYDYYTYHVGGHKVVNFEKMFAEKPEKVISEAVRRMLPKSKMGKHMLAKLKVYRGSEHPHAAQQPKPLDLN